MPVAPVMATMSGAEDAVDMVARVTRHEDHQTSEDWRMRLRQWEEEMIPFLDMINDAFRVISKSYAYATPTICTEIDPHTLQRFYMMRHYNVMTKITSSLRQ